MSELIRFADILYKALKDNYQVDPISEINSDLTIDDAYEIQLINYRNKIEEGSIVTGKKIGLTSRGMQESIGVDQPDFGMLYDDMEVKNGLVEIARMAQPKVEGELAFILKEDVGKDITYENIIKATDFVTPAIEIVDSRIKDWNITIVDTVADNASCGRYIISDVKIDPKIIDLKKIKMDMYKNDILINSGYATEVQDDPVNAVVWLAKTMRKYNIEFKKGDIILSGAFTAALPAKKNDKFICDFNEYGKVEVKFY